MLDLDLIGFNGEMTAGEILFGGLVVLGPLLFVLVVAGNLTSLRQPQKTKA